MDRVMAIGLLFRSSALPQEMVKEAKTPVLIAAALQNRSASCQSAVNCRAVVSNQTHHLFCHCLIPRSAEELQRVAAFVRSANAKICFRPAKQAFATARMAIGGKCQGRQEYFPNTLLQFAASATSLGALIGQEPFDQINRPD
jgi:hypothetical protein